MAANIDGSGPLAMTVDVSTSSITTESGHPGGDSVYVSGSIVYIPLTAHYTVTVADDLTATVTSISYTVG